MIRSLAGGQKAALIVNECQLGIIDPAHAQFPALAEQVQASGMVGNIAALIAAFRARGFPVVFTPAALRPDMADKLPNTMISAISRKARIMVAGSAAVRHPPELEPLDTDFVIQRGASLIAFHGTTLDLTLRRLKVETVVVTGVSTNVGIPGIAMAAGDFGYSVVIPEDCIAGGDPATHRVIVDQQLRMLATVTTKDEVIAQLRSAAIQTAS